MSVADELEKLKKLHDAGTITDEQYERACNKVLSDEREARDEKPEEKAKEKPKDEEPDRKKRREEEDDRDEDEERRPQRRRRDDYDDDDDYDAAAERRRRQRKKKSREWCMILHLSLLAGHLVVLGGIVAPIVIWQVKKDEFPEVDRHGKNAMNWLITWIIFMAVSGVLVFVVVGIPLLVVGGIVGVVFPIIAGLKANDGKFWKYPLAITFLK